MSIADEIERLSQLHQRGALTDAEFAEAKRKLLDGMAAAPGAAAGASTVAPGPAIAPDVAANINRLRRSRIDRWVGGVCGGFALYTGVEAWIWRLILALAVIFGGTGILIYILAWIFIPEEEFIGIR